MNYAVIVRADNIESAVADFDSQFESVIAEQNQLNVFKGETRYFVADAAGQPVTDRDGIDPEGYGSEKKARAAIEAAPVLARTDTEDAIRSSVVAALNSVADDDERGIVLMLNARVFKQNDMVETLGMTININRQAIEQ